MLRPRFSAPTFTDYADGDPRAGKAEVEGPLESARPQPETKKDGS